MQLSKPAICLVNKMDADADESKYREFLKQLNDRTNEEYLRNLSEDCRPEKVVDFEDVIPISAKFNRKSVDFVKDRLRKVIDDFDKKSDGNLKQLSAVIEKATTERIPKIYWNGSFIREINFSFGYYFLPMYRDFP